MKACGVGQNMDIQIGYLQMLLQVMALLIFVIA
jgi:hypothetical protein